MTRYERRAHTRQMTQEAHDWFYTVLGAALIAALVLAATVGHAWVSAKVAHGQMPVIYTETFIPRVSK